MAFIYATIAGDDKIVEILSTLSPQLEGKVAEQLNIAATNIERNAKKLCPVDVGRLRSSIRPQFFKSASRVAYTIYTDVKYAPFVEFGTGVHATKGNGRKTPWVYRYRGKKRKQGFYITKGMKPKPFLFPAYEQERKQLLSRLGRIAT